MPTQQQIQNTLLSASQQMSALLGANLNKLKVGNSDVKWAQIRQFKKYIKGLTFQYDMAQYDTTQTISLYECLNTMIGINPSMAVVNPNYQSDNTTIIVDGEVGTIFNSNKIPFTNTTSVGLLNYNIAYKSIYGNNPILSIYVTGYTQDEQTPPTITYQDNDITKDILSITWDYPLPVSGYIQISGSPA